MRWRVTSTNAFSTTHTAKLLLPILYVVLGCIIGISITSILQHHVQLATHVCAVLQATEQTGRSQTWKKHSLSQAPPQPIEDFSQPISGASNSDAGAIGQALSLTEQLQRKFSRLPRMHDIPPHSDVFLTYSNGHYSNLMLNAAALVADLGYPIVVLAFDQAAAATCEKFNLPYMRSEAQMDTADFRQDRCIRAMEA
jgi:hypothetical protein